METRLKPATTSLLFFDYRIIDFVALQFLIFLYILKIPRIYCNTEPVSETNHRSHVLVCLFQFYNLFFGFNTFHIIKMRSSIVTV